MPYDPKRRLYIGDVVPEAIPVNQQSTISRYVKRMRGKPSPTERLLYAIVDKIGRRLSGRVRYVKQRPFFVGQGISFIADVYFQKFKLIVEADGNDHLTKDAQDKDAWRDRVLFDGAGISTCRLTNDAIQNDPAKCMETIVRALVESPNATLSFHNYLAVCIRRWGHDWYEWRECFRSG